MIMKIVLYVHKYIFINTLKWTLAGMVEYLAEAASDTLYKMYFWECFICRVFNSCWCVFVGWCWFSRFLVSCYGLDKARLKVWRPSCFTSTSLTSPAACGLTDRRPSSVNASCWRCSGCKGREPPSSRLSPGEVPLCGSETSLRRAVCSTQIWTLESQTCFTLCLSSVDGPRGPCGCLLFCPAFAC